MQMRREEKMPDLGFNLVDVAQGFLIVVASLLGALGLRRGLNSQTVTKATEVTSEIAGALVDSSSVHKLTAAVNTYTEEVVHTRKCLHTLNGNLEEFSDQIRELRASVVRLGDILYQRH